MRTYRVIILFRDLNDVLQSFEYTKETDLPVSFRSVQSFAWSAFSRHAEEFFGNDDPDLHLYVESIHIDRGRA